MVRGQRTTGRDAESRSQANGTSKTFFSSVKALARPILESLIALSIRAVVLFAGRSPRFIHLFQKRVCAFAHPYRERDVTRLLKDLAFPFQATQSFQPRLGIYAPILDQPQLLIEGGFQILQCFLTARFELPGHALQLPRFLGFYLTRARNSPTSPRQLLNTNKRLNILVPPINGPARYNNSLYNGVSQVK